MLVVLHHQVPSAGGFESELTVVELQEVVQKGSVLLALSHTQQTPYWWWSGSGVNVRATTSVQWLASVVCV